MNYTVALSIRAVPWMFEFCTILKVDQCLRKGIIHLVRT